MLLLDAGGTLILNTFINRGLIYTELGQFSFALEVKLPVYLKKWTHLIFACLLLKISEKVFLDNQMTILMSCNSTLARIMLKYFEWIIESLQKKMCNSLCFYYRLKSQYVKKILNWWNIKTIISPKRMSWL